MTTDAAPPAPAAPATPLEPGRAPRRIPMWDTARFVAVTLVVVGHAIQRQTAGSEHALALYTFIYAFHMPAFGVISGYFSSAATPTAARMRRTFTDIVVPYIVMQTIWTVVQAVVEGGKEFNPTKPTWTLWFLLALGIFRLILPYLAILRWPLVWALALSVGVGYLDNVDSTFSLGRAISLLPFFLLGWQVKEWGVFDRWYEAPRRTVVRVRVAAARSSPRGPRRACSSSRSSRTSTCTTGSSTTTRTRAWARTPGGRVACGSGSCCSRPC